MRPIVKKQVGETVYLYEDIFDMNTVAHAVESDYPDYGKTRKVLLANLGNYCSYCEYYFENGALLQTEHVQPKKLQENGVLKYDNLKSKWTNFLLACATCNGKGNKGNKDVVLDNVHLPHRNNTYLSLCYKPAGVVTVNPNLAEPSRSHAQALIDLVGLDKGDSETDYRCTVRRHTWEKAQRLRKLYEKGDFTLDALIAYIKECHCWSIWFTVFRGHDEVRKALIEEFPGTCATCFDSKNHYDPIPRNTGKNDDVV